LRFASVWNIDTGAAFKSPLSIINIDTKENWQSVPVWELYADWQSVPVWELYADEKRRNP